MLYDLTNLLFFLFLTICVPILTLRSSRTLQTHPLPRIQLYASAAVSQWILALVGLGVGSLVFKDFSQLGFLSLTPATLICLTAALSLGCLTALGIFVWLHVQGYWAQETENTRVLIPNTRKEKILATAIIAPTAGFCEEFLYRGYLHGVLAEKLDSIPWSWFLSSLAFGLAHSYQGYTGVIRASLLGGLLAYPVVFHGSLYPSMMAHFAVDAAALAWVGPRFWKSQEAGATTPC